MWSQSEAALAHQQLILLITDIIEHFKPGFVQSTMANQLALDQWSLVDSTTLQCVVGSFSWLISLLAIKFAYKEVFISKSLSAHSFRELIKNRSILLEECYTSNHMLVGSASVCLSFVHI